jgi:UDP-galactose transporter B1
MGGSSSPSNEAASSQTFKFIFGVAGIYASFLYYGSLQEDVFRFKSPDGVKFTQAWFLQVLEALANVVVGYVGMQVFGKSANLPKKMFALSGFTQVCAKAFTSLSLANGLSFPVATLAKSGKMVPVMIGSLLLGGAKYSVREYLQVLAIILGTAIVSMGGKSGGDNSVTGIVFILLSLACDGVTGGVQKKLKAEMSVAGVKPTPYDFMFWTNLFMLATAAVISLGLQEVSSGMTYCLENPEIMNKIMLFSACSAVGQSFIFFTISNFEPLVCTTVTTTRKIFSVLLSIFLKGHVLSAQGWGGISLACFGILAEMQDKMSGAKKPSPKKA